MKYEQAIGKALVINITTLNEGEGVTITVSNNGSRINEELGNRIFEPFATTKNWVKARALVYTSIWHCGESLWNYYLYKQS
jgi:light-regulated signal transduction histidine kinase (bacteriophytochrome)